VTTSRLVAQRPRVLFQRHQLTEQAQVLVDVRHRVQPLQP